MMRFTLIRACIYLTVFGLFLWLNTESWFASFFLPSFALALDFITYKAGINNSYNLFTYDDVDDETDKSGDEDSFI